MKVYSINKSNQYQNSYAKSFRGSFPIDGGGGAKVIPEWYKAEAVKKTTEGASVLGWIVAGFAAVVALGSILAHKIDKDLVNTGELDTSDIYNPETDRMYM